MTSHEGDRPEGAPPPPKPNPYPGPGRTTGRSMYSDRPAESKLRVNEIWREAFLETLAEMAAERAAEPLARAA